MGHRNLTTTLLNLMHEYQEPVSRLNLYIKIPKPKSSRLPEFILKV